MTSECFQQIERLFHEARKLGAEERVALLDASCADHPDLRREVESLLGEHDRVTDRFMNASPLGAAFKIDDPGEALESVTAVPGRI